jgi:pyruvate/2-oxoglutarate dehydrogenase complex dihydrolipoamide dehydrogenase (E3) component
MKPTLMGTVYDLIVIGSGPAGQRAAIYGAKLGKKIALVEMREVVGGACARPCCIFPATTTSRSTA